MPVDVIKRGAIKSAETYIKSYHSVSLLKQTKKALKPRDFKTFINNLASWRRVELPFRP